jgi:hypothetical protein
MSKTPCARQPCRTESIAVGNQSLVAAVKKQMPLQACGRHVRSSDAGYALRETITGDNDDFQGEKSDTGPFSSRFGAVQPI